MKNLTRLVVAAAVLLAAGCSHSSNSVLPLVPQHGAMATAVLKDRTVAPNACNTKDKETVNVAGGTFVIPACGGTTSRITYGTNKAPSGSTATFVSATTNPNKTACGVPKGETIVAYFTAELKSSASEVAFGSTTKKSNITNPAFKTTSTYSIFGYVFGTEEITESLGHPNSHGALTFSSPVNGRTIPSSIFLCFELGTP
jgi:hypothetical protein